ncbi:hypothetical protein [Agrococcus sp. DT81.2]|uniref:hypothetical protein n=1 Tax=Agrococcus sp. DT81.2 TaxID=3393414 RepID=UPI003CE47C19
MLRRLALGAALVVGASMVLVGCTPPEPTETTQPTASQSVVPTPDESQLLASARAAWDAYRQRLTEYGAEPTSATSEGLLEVASPEVAAGLLANFEDAAERRLHTEGDRVTTAFEVSDFTAAPALLKVAVCMDLTGERYVGDEGVDLTPPDRPDERGSVVELVRSESGSDYVVAGESELDASDPVNPCDF